MALRFSLSAEIGRTALVLEVGFAFALKQEGAQWLAGLEFTSIGPECHTKVQMFVRLLVALR